MQKLRDLLRRLKRNVENRLMQSEKLKRKLIVLNERKRRRKLRPRLKLREKLQRKLR